MAMFAITEYDSDYFGPGEKRYCPFCGSDDFVAVESIPWQYIVDGDEAGSFVLVASGEDLKCYCRDCGGIFFSPGYSNIYRPEYLKFKGGSNGETMAY